MMFHGMPPYVAEHGQRLGHQFGGIPPPQGPLRLPRIPFPPFARGPPGPPGLFINRMHMVVPMPFHRNSMRLPMSNRFRKNRPIVNQNGRPNN